MYGIPQPWKRSCSDSCINCPQFGVTFTGITPSKNYIMYSLSFLFISIVVLGDLILCTLVSSYLHFLMILLFLISKFLRVLNVVFFFWVIPRHLNFMFRRFGTLCLFHLHRQVDV